jgi:copper chaperone
VKKILVFALSALLMVALVSSSALAGANCGGSKTADKTAKTCGAKATQASAKTEGMTPEQCAAKMGMTPEECAKLCGMSAEEHAKLCAGKEHCGFTQMSVKGMTCGGCESSVKSALSSVDGVHKVIKVDYKTGTALVCCDPTKVDGKALTTAVTNKGYEAEIIPAVAKTTTTDDKASKVAGKGCAPGCAKTCAAHAKTGGCTDKKTDKTKTTPKSDEG